MRADDRFHLCKTNRIICDFGDLLIIILQKMSSDHYVPTFCLPHILMNAFILPSTSAATIWLAGIKTIARITRASVRDPCVIIVRPSVDTPHTRFAAWVKTTGTPDSSAYQHAESITRALLRECRAIPPASPHTGRATTESSERVAVPRAAS